MSEVHTHRSRAKEQNPGAARAGRDLACAMLPALLPRSLALVLPLVGCAGAEKSGGADLYCGSAPPLCSTVPRDAAGAYIYNNGTNAEAPWVIGRDDIVTLATGAHAPGTGFVFIVEHGALHIIGLGSENAAPAAVLLEATVVVCDHGAVYATAVDLTLAQTQPQQHPWLGYGNASIAFGPDVRITAIAPAVPRSVRGQFLTVMLDNSSLYTHPGFTMSRFQLDAWELASVGNATVAVVSPAPIFMETYVGNTATLALVNVSYADVFFVVCQDGPVLQLPPLPALCAMPAGLDTAGSNTVAQQLQQHTADTRLAVRGQCLSPTHEPLTWQLGPPSATFRFLSEDSRLFSWAVSTHVGSSVAVSGAAPTANFCVGLGDLGGVVSLSTRTGKDSAIEGLTDRNVTVAPGTDVLAWHLWCDKIQLAVLPGSQVGDLTLGQGSIAGVSPGSVLSQGMVVVPQGAELQVVQATVNNGIYMSGGLLLANMAVITSQISATGDSKIFVANSVLTATAGVPALRDTAALYTTTISSPVNGSKVRSGALSFVDITGTLNVATATGELPVATGAGAFPTAQLLLYKCTAAGGVACGDPAIASFSRWDLTERSAPTVLQKFTAPVKAGGSLHRWRVGSLKAGDYLLQLKFDASPASPWVHAFTIIRIE